MQKQKKPFYGERTKKRILKEYLSGSATMDELAKLHGILGSNTISDWVKKYGNLGISKFSKSEIMSKSPYPIEQKTVKTKKGFLNSWRGLN